MRHCGMQHRGSRTAVIATAAVAAIALTAWAMPGEAAGNKKRSADGSCRSIVGTWSSWMSGVFGKNDTHFNADQTIKYFGVNGSWSCRNGEYTHTWQLLGEQGPYRLSPDGKRLIKIRDGSVSFVRGDGGTTRTKREAAPSETERRDVARKETDRGEPERKQAEAPPEAPEPIEIRNAVTAKLKKADLTDSNPRDASADDITGSLKSEPVTGKDQIMLSVRIVNESKYTAAVGYFSQDGTDEWPSYGSFHVSPGRAMTVRLACRPGKVLCMGARALEDRAVEWGVGLINTINDPSACMYTCGRRLETTRLLKE